MLTICCKGDKAIIRFSICVRTERVDREMHSIMQQAEAEDLARLLDVVTIT